MTDVADDVADDFDVLRKANARMLASRLEMGLDPSGAGNAGVLVGPGRAGRPVSVREALGPLVKPGDYCCGAKLRDGVRCGAKIPFPGICANCAKRTDDEERAEAIRERVATRIPEKFHDVTWESIPSLRRDGGTLPRVAVDSERLTKIRQALDTEQRVVLVGPPGCGKSTVAAAYVRAALESGVERARFVPAILLDDTEEGRHIAHIALNADRLVIDDVGAECHGAPAEGGLAAQRIKVIDNLISLRWNKNRGVVVTTPHNKAKTSSIYGGGIARRIFGGAARIDLGDK